MTALASVFLKDRAGNNADQPVKAMTPSGIISSQSGVTHERMAEQRRWEHHNVEPEHRNTGIIGLGKDFDAQPSSGMRAPKRELPKIWASLSQQSRGG